MGPCEQPNVRAVRSYPGVGDVVLALALLAPPAVCPLLVKPLMYQEGLSGGIERLSFFVFMGMACMLPVITIGIYVTRMILLACWRTWNGKWLAWRLGILVVAMLLAPIGLELSRAMTWRGGSPFLLGFRERVTSQFDLKRLRARSTIT